MVFYTHLQIANFIVLYLRIIRIDKPAGVRVIVPVLQAVQPVSLSRASATAVVLKICLVKNKTSPKLALIIAFIL